MHTFAQLARLIEVSTVVVNLEPSIAVTQNFVSQRELKSVLLFMRDRPFALCIAFRKVDTVR